jgi:hypothetical protein
MIWHHFDAMVVTPAAITARARHLQVESRAESSSQQIILREGQLFQKACSTGWHASTAIGKLCLRQRLPHPLDPL